MRALIPNHIGSFSAGQIFGALFVAAATAAVVMLAGVQTPVFSPSSPGALYAASAEDVQVTCDTDGELISTAASAGSHYGCYCQNNSTTAVHFGGSGVSTSSPSACQTNCSDDWFLALSGQYCLTAAGTQGITCNCAVAP